MNAQWDCLLQNLGEWQGSFTRLSACGEPLEETPTLVSLVGLNDRKTIRQVIRRLVPDASEQVLEYSSLGRGVLFFDNGAFSQGSIQFAPFSEFGAELGLIESQDGVPKNRRLRLVQIFNRESQLDQVTLIREQRAGTAEPERPPLQIEDLIGTWAGEAVTLYPDWRSPTLYPTVLTIRRDRPTQITQELSFGMNGNGRSLVSHATIHGNRLKFGEGTQTVQVLLLPDGASSTCPTHIQNGHAFFLEAGWLLQPNLRQRMIRSYSDRGEWISLTLITERKID